MRPLQRRIPAMRDAPQQHPGKSYPNHWGYLRLKRSHKGLISGQILIVGDSTDSYRGLFNPYCFGSTVRRVPSDFHEPCSMLAKHPLVQPTQVAFVAHLLSNMAWAWSVLPEPDKSNYSTGAAEVHSIFPKETVYLHDNFKTTNINININIYIYIYICINTYIYIHINI
jgi:hypothetical protein